MLDQHPSSYSSNGCVGKVLKKITDPCCYYSIISGVVCKSPLEHLSDISANPKKLFLSEQGHVCPRESGNLTTLVKIGEEKTQQRIVSYSC